MGSESIIITNYAFFIRIRLVLAVKSTKFYFYQPVSQQFLPGNLRIFESVRLKILTSQCFLPIIASPFLLRSNLLARFGMPILVGAYRPWLLLNVCFINREGPSLLLYWNIIVSIANIYICSDIFRHKKKNQRKFLGILTKI